MTHPEAASGLPLDTRAAGDAQTEALLHEWRSPCGEDAQMPLLDAKLPPR